MVKRILYVLLICLILNTFVSCSNVSIVEFSEVNITVIDETLTNYNEFYDEPGTDWCLSYLLNEEIISEQDLFGNVTKQEIINIFNRSLSILGSDANLNISNYKDVKEALEQYYELAVGVNAEKTIAENETFNFFCSEYLEDNQLTYEELLNTIAIIHKTEKYIRDFSQQEVEHLGMDFYNERYSTDRLNKPIDEIDVVNDYDFNYLKNVSYDLQGIDRSRVLNSIFLTVTKQGKTEHDKYMLMLNFLQKVSFHGVLQPMHENGVMVTDPLILLTVNEMKCGAVARLAVDLYISAGYDARLAQLGGHQIAEVYYEGDWHYLDADLYENGLVVIIENEIPSLAELSHYPQQLDSIINNSSSMSFNLHIAWSSFHYFDQDYYSTDNIVYNKTSNEEMGLNYLYGWNDYEVELINEREFVENKSEYVLFSQIKFEKIEINDNVLSITLPELSENQIKAKIYYRVFISDESRGWQYEDFLSDDVLMKFRSDAPVYSPNLYEIYGLLPENYEIFDVDGNTIQVPITAGQIYYINVSEFSEYAETLNRDYMRLSDEIKIIG